MNKKLLVLAFLLLLLAPLRSRGLTRQTCLVGTIGAIYDLTSGIKTEPIAQ
jgi:hypothetical protein